MDILEVEGTKIAYTVSGDESKEKIVLIHGLFVNSDCWKYQLPWLEEKYHLLRFDLYGHGRSIKPQKHYTIRKYATDMRILLNHLGWTDNLNIIGHSLGGMVALVYALENQDQVAKLVIASSYCLVTDKAVTDVLAGVQSNPIEKFGFEIAKQGLNPFDQETAEWIGKLMSDYMSKEDAIRATNASIGFNICKNLHVLEIPTLVIVGEKDSIRPVWASEKTHELLPNSELVIIKDAGHMVIIDHFNEFNKKVESFLSG